MEGGGSPWVTVSGSANGVVEGGQGVVVVVVLV